MVAQWVKWIWRCHCCGSVFSFVPGLSLAAGVAKKKQWVKELTRRFSKEARQVASKHTTRCSALLTMGTAQEDHLTPIRSRHQERKTRSSLVASGLRIPRCHCCGVGSMISPGISTCRKYSQKKTPKTNQKSEIRSAGVPTVAQQDRRHLGSTGRQV